MKNHLLGAWILTSAVVVACLAGNISRLQAQPTPPDTTASLPPDIAPDSPLGQVVKLVQSGVEASVIKSFIANSGSAFNLDAEKIVTLNDLGVPTELINAMMDHDKLFAAAATPPPPAPAPAPANAVVDTTIVAPTAPVTVEYFDNTLSPYGSWVMVEGYGRCWRPTTVIYDSKWQPYCDRGHWVYSDCGWYWDSDYAWGATFHYGRWFRNDRFGWCWWPDTVWSPSWVSWRQSDAYCGWAPLPPFAIYRPGFGFTYRGANVAVGFDFGLSASCFTFVPVDRFCERHPRYYRTDARRGGEIFQHTTVINNFRDDHRVVFNGGISVDQVRGATHRPLQPIAVRELPNAGRQGWRGADANRADHRVGNNAFDNGAIRNAPGSAVHSGPGLRDNHNNDVNANHGQNFGQPNPSPSRNEIPNTAGRSPTPESPGNRNGQRDREANNHSAGSAPPASPNSLPTVNNHPANGAPFIRNQPGQDNRPVGGNERLQSQFTPANNMPALNSTTVINNHPANNGTPVLRPPPSQSLLTPGGNDRNPGQNNRSPQPSQFTPANNVPIRSAPSVDLRQTRNIESPIISASPPRSGPSIDQRQLSSPALAERPAQREQHFEPRQNPVVSAPRYVAPPTPPSPAPAQNSQRNSDQNSNRGGDKDKPNH